VRTKSYKSPWRTAIARFQQQQQPSPPVHPAASGRVRLSVCLSVSAPFSSTESGRLQLLLLLRLLVKPSPDQSDFDSVNRQRRRVDIAGSFT
jgi:hypothetical protein